MIVGLTGPARCGKNTIADHLVAKYFFTRIAFSDALYKEVAEAFDVSEEMLRRDETKDVRLYGLALRYCRDDQFVAAVARSCGVAIEDAPMVSRRSPRELLQWWGTEYRRAQDPDYWVKKLAERMCQITGDGGDIHDARVAVDGVRFPNEEAFLRSLPGFEMWHVVRQGGPEVAAHASEIEQKRITVDMTRDALLQNNGTIPQLRAIVDMLVEGRL